VDQTIINWLLGGMGTLLGFLLNALWQAVKDLQAADKELADKVAGIEIVVAGQYVRRDEFERMYRALFEKLDRIHDKLDSKEDRHV